MKPLRYQKRDYAAYAVLAVYFGISILCAVFGF